MAFDPGVSDFDTLYNMNVIPGDQWQLVALPESSCDPLSHMLVTDTGTIVIDDVPLRWLAIEIQYYSVWDTAMNWFALDTIVERIGTLSAYLLPMDLCTAWVDGNEAGTFRCYSDAQIDHMADEYIPCDMVVGIGEAFFDRIDLQLWPNPGLDDLNISWDPSNSTSVRFEIHSMLGELLRSEKAAVSPITIGLQDLPAGCYSIHMIDGEQRSVEKWLKL